MAEVEYLKRLRLGALRGAAEDLHWEQVLINGHYMIYIELRMIFGVSADSQQQHSVEHDSLVFLMSKRKMTTLDTTKRRALNGTGPRAYGCDESFVDRPAFVHRAVSCRTTLGSGVQVSLSDGIRRADGQSCVGFVWSNLIFFVEKAIREIPFYL